jgi:hypothetical protein
LKEQSYTQKEITIIIVIIIKRNISSDRRIVNRLNSDQRKFVAEVIGTFIVVRFVSRYKFYHVQTVSVANSLQ